MRPSVTSSVALVGLIVGLASFAGCGSSESNPIIGGSGGATSGTGGQSASGGASGTGGSASGGSTGSGGSGSGGSSVDGGGDVGMADTGGGTGGMIGTADITKVRPTAGCGKPPTGTGAQTIMTMGTKPMGCADSRCGDWAYTRNYNVMMPANYDMNRAYPLVFMGPGCGGGETNVYSLNNNANNTVIRVGIRPPPNTIGHATNPNQGCFDDKEGDDSVDWVFYENLWDRLATQLCFDQNRVFAAGNSSGAWFSNEVGCKYAGDEKHPIRGIMPNTGGLPNQPMYKPTCTNKPMAGMWVHEVGDSENPFTGNKYAIARAMPLNKCTIGTSFDNTMFDNFPIGGGNGDATCRMIRGCDPLYPLVVCALPGGAHGSHEGVANPGFSTFLQMFQKAPFLTP